MLARMAGFLRPLMLRPPPALGSKRPGDLLSLLREAGRAAGLARRDVHELFRVMTMSVGDLLDEWFESDVIKGAFASTGVVGVWAGPRTPGTAYNLLHHALGELDGVSGLWGHVKGGMGGISQALARSAEASGATIRTGAAGALDRRERRAHDRRHARERRADPRPARRVGRAPAHDHPRPGRRRALPRGRGPGHAPLPQPRRLGEGQLHPVRAAALRGRLARGRRAPAAHRHRALPVDRLPRARLAGRHARCARRGPVRRGGGAERRRPVAHRRRHHGDDDVHPVRAVRRGGLARRRARGVRASAASTSSPTTPRT